MKNQKTYKGNKWQVTFLFLFSWLCHSVSGQLHYSIAEELGKDAVIANIVNDLGLDIKEVISRKFSIVSHVTEKYLSVNLGNGNLYVKDRIDRERLCRTAPSCFLTFDAVVENPLNIFSVKIEIQDINDNAPVFVSEIFTLEMNEQTSPGTHLVLQHAEDPDIGINAVQSYRLSDNQYFRLNEKNNSDLSKTPELVLEKPLDRETQSIHELILTASDGGNPVRTGTALIRIIVTDYNDNLPVFTQEVYKVSVSENAPINSTVIILTATDKDEGTNAQITYSISKTSENFFTSSFNINPITGEITTKEKLNFENTEHYEMSVQAKDGGGLVAQSKVLIEIIDENDNAPKISIRSLSTPIPEDSAPGTLIALIEVHDQDSGENGEVDCQIIGPSPFQLLSSSSRYYKIVNTGSLDRELVPWYNITILATDRGSPQLFTMKFIKLDISDVNDNPPMFVKSTFVAYLPENNLPGASIYNIHASDPDYGDNAKIIYSISNINTEDFAVSPYFSINIETGVLYAQRSFDYEQHKEFQMQVSAKDNGSPTLSSNATLIIHIIDQNDNAPKILYPSTESGGSPFFEMVPFVSEQGSLITKVIAVDADSGHNSWLSYHFIQMSEPSPFSISQHTGEIRSSRIFHEKDISKHKVVIMVKDNGDPSLSVTVTLSIYVGDHFQQVVPQLNNQFNDEQQTSNMHNIYLVISLALISLLFIITVMLVIISKCKESKPPPEFPTLNTNLYSQFDPRMLSHYNNGTLSLPYSYNVCVALDSTESDFSFLKPNQNVPVENLIDADDSGLGNESSKESFPSVEQAQPNADWRVSQAQRPGPSGAQPTEESGVWPNNQFETERLQAMILASANEAAEGSAIGGGTGTMGLSARYGPQFTLQHLPDYRQNIYIPGTTSTLTNAAGKGKSAAPSGGNKKKSGKKDKK
ncbi:protocadherin gamma-B5 isoform X36 [Xenopus tropicalis]|uniref:Protocadherin gamma-B5 isoform X36 n=1 Tax=Xenopus tropicalis TaxID=8364 RepID=A0A8J1J9U1_XENTR|nr:protocadherin gamma-B5 isoform X36 [Xenopus tropicalis]